MKWITWLPALMYFVHCEGRLSPVSVKVKTRNNRRCYTSVQGFEAFLLDTDELMNELRMECVSSVKGVSLVLLANNLHPTNARAASPLYGSATCRFVMIRGNHIRAIIDVLIARGIPAKWIWAPKITAKKP
jgi:translation initiation factor 2D